MAKKYVRNGGRRRAGTYRTATPQTLRLILTNPGVGGGETVYNGWLSAHGVRVNHITDSVVLGGYTLQGVIDGGWRTVAAIDVRGDGDDGEGSLIRLAFPGELDTAQSWVVTVPTFGGWVGAVDGGILTAVSSPTVPSVPSPQSWLQVASVVPAVVGNPGLWVPGVWQWDMHNGGSVMINTDDGNPLPGPMPWEVTVDGNQMTDMDQPSGSQYRFWSNIMLVVQGMEVSVAAYLTGWTLANGSLLGVVRNRVT